MQRVRVRMGELNWLALLLLASIVLMFDAVVIGRHVGLITLPGEMTHIDLARSGAISYIELTEAELRRDEASQTRSAIPVIAGARQRIASARNAEEVGMELAASTASIHSAVQADRLRAAKDRITELLIADSRVKAYKGRGEYVLVTPHGSGSGVQDRRNALSKATVTAIASDPAIALSPQAIEITISEQGVSFEAGDPEVQLRALSAELDQLRAATTEARRNAGLMEIEGKGLFIAAHDAPEAWAFDQIVHQKDIGDVLNALFAAGAVGAQVGGERIVATSSIRCIGPVVLVNQRPVAVNPVRILVVGDQWALEKALKPIAAEFARSGKKLEIRREPFVHLSAYVRGGP